MKKIQSDEVFDWIKSRLEKDNYENKKVANSFLSFNKLFPGHYSNEKSFGVAISRVKKQLLMNQEKELGLELDINDADYEIVKENVRLEKSRQRYMDRNRVERKSFRDHARIENNLEDLYTNLISILKKVNLNIKPKNIRKIKNEKEDCVGILQLTDLHFNEIVDSVFENVYDFEIASKRLKMFVDKAKIYFKANNVSKVIVCLTGDIINNNKIIDKKLQQTYNRAYAFILGCYLLENVIIDLLQDFEIKVASVVGNESRIDDEYGFTGKLITDNFDFCIHNILRMIFRDVENITFIDGKYDEKILTVLNTNILMLHGNTISTNDNHKNIQSVIGKYAAKGINIDFVIYGHIHSANLGDIHARSSSLVGSNNYSNNALQLHGRASQNIHLIYKDGNRDSIKIDLQNVEHYIGYNLEENLINEMKAKVVEKEDILIEV